MPTVELPDAWALVAPCGCTDGLCLAVLPNGKIVHPDAADAWKLFTPLKKDREREAKQGFKVEPRFGTQRVSADCTHDPKWGIK